MNGYEKRTHQKKELILKTAAEMFLENGVSNTSVADIAQKAKVSKVTIFNYFESKENLAREALKSFLKGYIDKYIEIFESGEPFLKVMELLFSMAKQTVSMMGKHLFNDEVWKDPVMQQVYIELTTQSMTSMMKFIEQGKNEGIIDPAIPTDAIMAFISMWTSLTNPGTHEVSVEYSLGISKLFFFGVFGDKNNFGDRMKLYKDYERAVIGEDSK